MRIAIDVREACRPRPTGKGMWVRGAVTALIAENTHTFVLLGDVPPPSSWLRPNVRNVRLLAGFAWHLAALRFLRRERPDVYMSPTSFIVPALLPHGIRCVPVVHDFIAFRHEPHDRKAVLLERMFLPRALRRAAHILTTSDATCRDLRERFPRIPAEAVSAVFAGPPRENPPPTRSDGCTIVCVGTLCPRKNQRRLIEAFTLLPAALRERSRLVLVGGRGWHDADIVSAARGTPGVGWKGYLADAELDSLLQHCAVFAYPSLYEGFGLPVLDAFARGIPVLTSDRGSLKELAGSAALIVNPEDVRSIADGLAVLLSDAQRREALCARGELRANEYSWRRTANLCDKVLSSL